MHTTNYASCFILVAQDCPATEGLTPVREGTIAALQHDLLTRHPYRYTSDDLLFELHAIRNGLTKPERKAARSEFFSRPVACMRASPLPKKFGWGVHHDENSRVAIYGVDSAEYRRFASDETLVKHNAMRTRRA